VVSRHREQRQARADGRQPGPLDRAESGTQEADREQRRHSEARRDDRLDGEQRQRAQGDERQPEAGRVEQHPADVEPGVQQPRDQPGVEVLGGAAGAGADGLHHGCGAVRDGGSECAEQPPAHRATVSPGWCANGASG
jgi:hypothetical protein